VEKFIFWEVLASIQTGATTAKRNLLTDTLEPTNKWYAIAKITGKPVRPSENNSIRIT
jgi:hypothetical protein